MAAQRAPRFPARVTPFLNPSRTGTRSACSRSRQPRASPSSFLSGTAACWSRRSRSTAGPRQSWPATSLPRRAPGLKVQLCGDAHLSNFGGFASPERSLVFDLNDFDETLPGPFEWDVKRLAASFEIAGRDRDFSDAERRTAVLSVLRVVSRGDAQLRDDGKPRALVLAARRRGDRSWAAGGGRQEAGKGREQKIAKARSKDSMRAFGKLTQIVDGKPQIVSDPPLIVPIRELLRARPAAISRPRFAHSCGSTGARCNTTVAFCSRSSATQTWRARSWVSAASAPVPGSCSCSARTRATRSSCRSRRRRPRCSSRTSAGASSAITAGAWSRVSG